MTTLPDEASTTGLLHETGDQLSESSQFHTSSNVGNLRDDGVKVLADDSQPTISSSCLQNYVNSNAFVNRDSNVEISFSLTADQLPPNISFQVTDQVGVSPSGAPIHSQEMVIQAIIDASGGPVPFDMTNLGQQSKDTDATDGGSQQSAKKHKRVYPNFEEVPPTTLPSDYVTNATVKVQSDTSNMKVNQPERQVREVSALKYCDIDFVGESAKDLTNFANEDYYENRSLRPATSVEALQLMNFENGKDFQKGGCEAYCDIDFKGRASVSREVGEGFANEGLADLLNSRRATDATLIFTQDEMMERTDSPICTAEIKVENLQVRLDENGLPTFSLWTPGDPRNLTPGESITLNAQLTTSDAFAKTFSASVSPVLSGLLNNRPLSFTIGGAGSGLSSPEYKSSNVQCHIEADGRLSPEASGNNARGSSRPNRIIEDVPPIGLRRSPSDLEATTWSQPHKGSCTCFPVFKRK